MESGVIGTLNSSLVRLIVLILIYVRQRASCLFHHSPVIISLKRHDFSQTSGGPSNLISCSESLGKLRFDKILVHLNAFCDIVLLMILGVKLR